jgi:hypothetical protein
LLSGRGVGGERAEEEVGKGMDDDAEDEEGCDSKPRSDVFGPISRTLKKGADEERLGMGDIGGCAVGRRDVEQFGEDAYWECWALGRTRVGQIGEDRICGGGAYWMTEVESVGEDEGWGGWALGRMEVE